MLIKLPTGEKKADEDKRMKMFLSFDTNGNGQLTMTEVHAGLKGVLFMKGTNSKAVASFLPAITRAFHAAKDSDGNSGKASETVGKAEFRALLVYLKRYIELLVAFNLIDTTDDRRVDRAEFEAAVPLLESWGVHMEDPTKEFESIDSDGGGRLLFDEFASWALKKGLSVTPHDTRQPSEPDLNLAAQHKSMEDVARKSAKKDTKPPQKSPAPKKVLLQLLDLTPDMSMSALVTRLPCGKTDLDKVARRELFSNFDVSNYGAILPSDVDTGLRALLATAGQRATEPPLAAVDLAFQLVTKFKHPADRCVGPADFRQYLCNLKWYNTPMGQGAHAGAVRLFREKHSLPRRLAPIATTRTI